MLVPSTLAEMMTPQAPRPAARASSAAALSASISGTEAIHANRT
jgi:hypothetical protein